MDEPVNALPAAVFSALESHPNVRAVRLAGSRAEGRASATSDWDFVVDVDDFPAVAEALPRLLSSLNSLSQLWDRLADHASYMLILRGPVKLDLIFAGVPHKPEGPWEVGPETLAAIDAHFWDWTLWLAGKQARGRDDLVRTELVKMWEHILRPLDVREVPPSLRTAVEQYRAARAHWEQRFQLTVPRDLDCQVLPRIRSSAR